MMNRNNILKCIAFPLLISVAVLLFGSRPIRTEPSVSDDYAAVNIYDTLTPILLKPDTLSLYPFLRINENYIKDTCNTMEPFYNLLKNLAVRNISTSTVVPVLHIGDSHIQPDILSGNVRKNLQAHFGNAGRGLIFPLKLAKTNEPADYAIQSATPWKALRLFRSGPKLQAGVAGNVLYTLNSRAALDISLTNNDYTHQFSRISVISSPNIRIWQGITDSDTFNFRPSGLSPYYHELTMPFSVKDIKLSVDKMPGRDSLFVYGIVLQTGNSGILYHNTGSNGACINDYLRTPVFLEQASALNPKLIIVSLGTNEAASTSFSSDVFRRQLDNFCTELKSTCPDAVLLLTTPLGCGKRYYVNRKSVYKPIDNMKKVRNIIVDYAAENSIACWDLYTVAGGEIMEEWYETKLLSTDRMHCTWAGYRLQGNLLYEALIKEYNKYVGNKLE